MRVKLAICLYHHQHGTDALVHAVPIGYDARRIEEYFYEDLVLQYSREDLEHETAHYGGVEFYKWIEEGHEFGFTLDGKEYGWRLHLQEL